jgi:hypothetical protein
MGIDYYNFDFWLIEADEALAGGPPGAPPGGGDPSQQPGGGQPDAGPALQGAGQNSPPGPNPDDQGGGEDVTQEPTAPEGMDDDEGQNQDFATWRKGFFKLAVKGDPVEMMNNLEPIREQTGLTAPERKFVEDNWNILVLRQNANIDKASKEKSER